MTQTFTVLVTLAVESPFPVPEERVAEEVHADLTLAGYRVDNILASEDKA